jgi:UDP-N-acetylmuramate dehydrogenase
MRPAPIHSNSLSWYRTSHHFLHYAELHSAGQLADIMAFAQEKNVSVYFLGNGSNTLFTRPDIETIVIKNNMPRSITPLSGQRFEISSATPVMQVLRYCLRHGLDSFYYLSSVPATIGGALAMNAGRGKKHKLSIFDFVESVTVLKNGRTETIPKDSLAIGYRKTPFTGIQESFILSATFHFPERINKEGNPILERIQWVRHHQDHSFPNGGSVFSQHNHVIMRCLMGRTQGDARWSPKTANWLQNTGNATGEDLLQLMQHAQKWHRRLLQPCAEELILIS